MSMVQVIREPEALEAVSADWDKALTEGTAGSVFLTSFWVLRWMRAFGDPQTNCVLLGRDDDGKIILQAPLIRTREHGFLTIRSMGNVHTSRWGFKADAQGMALLNKWLNKNCQPSLTRFGRIDPEMGHRSLLDTFYQVEAVELPIIECTTPYDDLIAAKSRNFRKSLRRALDRQSHLMTRVRTDGHACLDAVRRVSSKTWKFKEGTAIISDPATEKFFLSLLDPVCPASLVQPRLVLMRDTDAGDESVGFVICLSFNGSLYAIKMGLDERILDVSPGMGALNAMVEYACENASLHLVDLDARGPHGDYKMRWATRVETVETVLAFGNDIMGRTAHGLWRLKSKLKSLRAARGMQPTLPGESL